MSSRRDVSHSSHSVRTSAASYSRICSESTAVFVPVHVLCFRPRSSFLDSIQRPILGSHVYAGARLTKLTEKHCSQSSFRSGSLHCTGHLWVCEIPDWSAIVRTRHRPKQILPPAQVGRVKKASFVVSLSFASSGASFRRFHQVAPLCCQQSRGPRKG